MLKRYIPFFLCLTLICQSVHGGTDNTGKDLFAFDQLPDLPDPVGVAGPFAGIHNDALIVGGGANFPDGRPWEGGKKAWHDKVYVLQKDEDGNFIWNKNVFKLPRPIGYGISITTENGILCAGGCDGEKCFRDVFLLKWEEGKISIEQMPPLPRPLAFMTGAKIGNVVYVAGGQESVKNASATKNFWSLDLSKKYSESEFEWKELPEWPGPARVVALSAVQNDGESSCFYLFSGRNLKSGKITEYLSDSYCYSPAKGLWRKLSDVNLDGEPMCVMAGTAMNIGTAHIAVFGGSDDKIISQLLSLGDEIASLKERSEDTGSRSKRKECLAKADELTEEMNNLYNNHPGFSKDILVYHTITDTWTKFGELPSGSPVTTAIFRWNDDIIIPTGEISPGIRTSRIWKITAHSSHARFRPLDYVTIGIYLLCMAGIGFYCSKRGKSTNDFFKAGQRIPWWAAGLSIFGTQLSAITFMAIPAKAFATDWRYFIGNMTIIACAPLIVFFFLPFYRRLNVTTAYEYIERRFNVVVRLLASLMFILVQLGRLGIVLFLPSLAMSIVTGIDVNLCIITMSIIAIIYTVTGGIEAVIWTDVVQVIVFMGGALLVMILIAFNVPGGWNSVNDIAESAGKFRLLDFRFTLKDATFWVLLFGATGANIISYGSDQTVIQRYLTTKDEKTAAKSVWTSGILAIPASILFFGIGTVLFSFYKTHPQTLDPTMAKGDGIFPWFIVSQLPAGLSGLLTAALFAAAMSTLDSSMNSVATAVTTDFYRRFKQSADDRTCLKLAKWVTVIIGLCGMFTAMMLNAMGGKMHIWDIFNKLLGLFGGGLGGLFILAIFTKRANGLGALIGLFASAIVQATVQRMYSVHVYCYTITGIVSCLTIGYLASILIPTREKDIDGLTIYTLKDGENK